MISGENLETQFSMESNPSSVVEERPFHLLMIGDWTGDGERQPSNERNALEIDRDNFDEVMERVAPRVHFDAVSALRFSSLDDFHPDTIYNTLPIFANLRELRRRLSDGDTFPEAAREVRSWESVKTDRSEAQPRTNNTAPPSENLLNAILSQPGGGAPKPVSPVSDELSSFIGDVMRPHLVSIDEFEQKSMLAAVDAATGSVMRGILGHRRFRDLEAAWRALFLLVRRVETSTNLKIFLLDISKDELTADLAGAAELADSFVHGTLVKDSSGEPWAAVCGNYAFRPTVPDIAALIRLSQICKKADAPFVSHMRPELFGMASLTQAAQPSDLKISMDTSEGKLWTTLRGIAESEYLGMTIPRFLVRSPYGTVTDPTETFLFEEIEDTPVSESYVWANSCFVAALLLAQSFARSGWEMGSAMITEVDGLPTHSYVRSGETIFQGAVEAQLSETGCNVLIENGMMPIVSFRNTGRIRLVRFQSVCETGAPLRGRWRA